MISAATHTPPQSRPHVLSRPELHACLAVLIIAALWSTLLSCIYWPGLATEDGATRSVHALALLGEPKVTPNYVSHWFPPGLTLLMSASFRWFSTIGPVTMLQSFWVATSLGWLLVLSTRPRLGVLLLIPPLLYPPLFTHSIAHLADAWSVAALASLTICTILWHRRATPRHSAPTHVPSWIRAIITLLLICSCLVLLTFRANGVTVMPLLAACIIWLVRPWPRAFLGLLTIALCLAATPLLVRNIPWPRRDTVATAMIWEHVGMLKLAKDPSLTADYSLDQVCAPPATTQTLIERHNWITHDSIMFRKPAVIYSQQVFAPNHNIVRTKFKSLAAHEPLLFLRMKLQVWRTLLGLRGNAPLITLSDRVPQWTEPLGSSFIRTGPLNAFATPITEWNAKHAKQLEYTSLPIIWLTGAILTFSICLARKRPCWPAAFCLLFAITYFGAFFLITPGAQYRYFMPAHALLYVAIAAATIAAFQKRTAPLSSSAAPQTTCTSTTSSP